MEKSIYSVVNAFWFGSDATMSVYNGKNDAWLLLSSKYYWNIYFRILFTLVIQLQNEFDWGDESPYSSMVTFSWLKWYCLLPTNGDIYANICECTLQRHVCLIDYLGDNFRNYSYAKNCTITSMVHIQKMNNKQQWIEIMTQVFIVLFIDASISLKYLIYNRIRCDWFFFDQIL